MSGQIPGGSGQDMILDMQRLTKMLDASARALSRRGRDAAQAEKDYRMELAKCILTLRSEGMPATVIGDIARGDPGIASLKMSRDTAEAVYDAAKEYVNVLKIQIRVLEATIAREWVRD